MRRSWDITFVIGLGIFGFVVLVAYWIIWFAAPDVVRARGPEAPDYAIYVNFEQAFPLADGWLAIASLIGVLGLRRMRDWGFLFMLLAGSAVIFLGLMDLLYDIQHCMFQPFTLEAGMELAIVLLSLAIGPTVIVLLWRHRHRFIC